MSHALQFAEVVDAADHLSPDEQETLISILQRRVNETARKRITSEIAEARSEFAAGQCKSATPDEIMRELLK